MELWATGLAHAGGWDVTVGEVDVAPVQVQGPKAKALMSDLFGPTSPTCRTTTCATTCWTTWRWSVSRTGYSGEIRYEIYLHHATRNAGRLWDRIWEAGLPHDLRAIGPCRIAGIEGGMLAYGCDITLDTNPLEVGYDYKWMVDLRPGGRLRRQGSAEPHPREGHRPARWSGSRSAGHGWAGSTTAR